MCKLFFVRLLSYCPNEDWARERLLLICFVFLVFRRVVERKESLIYVACFCVPWILNKNTDLWFFGSSISKKTHNKKPSFFSFFFPFSASTFIHSSSLLFLVAKKQNKNRGNNKSFDIRFRWFLFNFLFFPQVLNCVSISDCLRIYTFNSRRPRSSLSENVNCKYIQVVSSSMSWWMASRTLSVREAVPFRPVPPFVRISFVIPALLLLLSFV